MTFFLGARGFLWKASVVIGFISTLVVLFYGIGEGLSPLLDPLVTAAYFLESYTDRSLPYEIVFSVLTLVTWTLIWYGLLSVFLFAVNQVRSRNGSTELGISNRRYREAGGSEPTIPPRKTVHFGSKFSGNWGTVPPPITRTGNTRQTWPVALVGADTDLCIPSFHTPPTE